MRESIQHWEEKTTAASEDENSPKEPKLSQYQFGHIYLGARQKECTLESVEESNLSDPAFHNIPSRLSNLVNSGLEAPESRSPRVRVHFQPSDKV